MIEITENGTVHYDNEPDIERDLLSNIPSPVEAVRRAETAATAAVAAKDAAEAAAQQAMTDTPEGYADFVDSFAPTYSSSSTYAEGDYVLYDSKLYKAKQDISTAEAWTADHWSFVRAMTEVSDLKDALNVNFTAYRTGTLIYEPLAFYRYTADGLTTVDFASMPLNTYVYAQYSVVKTALLNANFPLTWSDSDFVTMARIAGSAYYITVSIITVYNYTTGEKAEMIYYATASTNKYKWVLPSTDLTKQYFPADAKAVGDALALKQDSSALRNGRTNVAMNPWGVISRSNVGDTIDFRTFPLNTCCFTTYQYIKAGFANTNMPETDWADDDFIALSKKQISHNFAIQNSIITVYNFSKTRKIEMIYFDTASTDKYRWLSQAGTINNNTFENTINQYSNTYNVTASPTITTDTNNYLQATGDDTDMATAIETMLTQNGICNLGPGTFYVSGIDMPNETTIKGCGGATNIILLSSVTSGYAIKMGSRCVVESVIVSGGTTSPTITSEIGTRNGILWQGTAIPGESTVSSVPVRGTISNCYIRNFSGSGIYCYGTGTGVSNCLNVTNVYVYNSTVGINIAWLSEFHRFSNVDCRGCYYGIINNGGNNTFANCGFSKNIVGLLMDNTYDQSDNNSHGSFTNCVFNHSGNNNDGIAIHVIGCTAGEMFVGCQIFYGETVIENSEGIIFSSCNYGGGTEIDITIDGGGLVMFNGCCFKNNPSFTISNNTAFKVINSFLRDGTQVTLS